MDPDYSRAEVLDIIEREAVARGIPRDDFLRFAYIETGGQFDEHASRGAGGAKGLFQFVPSTAAQYGIAGQEFDAVANTRAAAQLYLDNLRQLGNRHEADGRPYLSGQDEPGGLDMYLAHQQGAGGYRSIQTAIATGEFSLSSTRANLINNVSARDIEAITGHSHADFKAMSDRDMANAFVQYWDAKFDRVRIPEKGIEPIAADVVREPQPQPQPEQAASGIALGAAHAMSIKYDDVKYGFGVKDPDSGRVDCSGWVVAMQNATMDEINAKAGRSVFGREDRFSPGYDSAAAIVQKAEQRSGVLLEGAAVTSAALREGMVIGEDNGPKSWDKGRFRGIDHVVMVVRDPASGELMVSQSRGGEGVELSPLDDYLAAKQAKGVKLYASDPLLEARSLLQEQAQGQVAPRVDGDRNAITDRLLRDGSRGDDVRRLQESLHELGYTGRNGGPLGRDGIFGPDTLHAVRTFQREQGLAADGVVGPLTTGAVARQMQAERAAAPESPASQATAAARLDSLMAGRVHPVAEADWQRCVTVELSKASPVREAAVDQSVQEQAEQQRQSGLER